MKFTVRSVTIVMVSALLFVLCIMGFLYAGFGSDSITVFEDGLRSFFHISIGNAALIYNSAAFILGILFARKHMGWGSVVNGFLIGILLNVLEPVFLPFFTLSDSLPFRIFLLVFAVLACSSGCGLLIVGDAGMNSLDAIVTAVSDKVKIQFRYGRILVDAGLMLTGYLLGGTVGIGSIVAVLCLGPMISFAVTVFRKIGF